MKIEEASFEILEFDPDALQKIERAARICYQFEPAGGNLLKWCASRNYIYR